MRWVGRECCISQGDVGKSPFPERNYLAGETESAYKSPDGPLGMSFSSALEMVINWILTEKWVFDIRFVEE